MGVEVGAGPAPAPAAQQVADDAVVGADVQAHLALDLLEQLGDPPVLLLLEDRPIEQRHRPVGVAARPGAAQGTFTGWPSGSRRCRMAITLNTAARSAQPSDTP